MTALIGIDLGGTKTEVAVLAEDGAFLYRHRQPTPGQDYSAILHTIRDLVEQALAATHMARPTVIGCGIPGCLDPNTALVRGASTLVLNGKAFAHDLSQKLQCQVKVQNDANCLAVSKAWMVQAKAAHWCLLRYWAQVVAGEFFSKARPGKDPMPSQANGGTTLYLGPAPRSCKSRRVGAVSLGV
jgi:predicted NBD/HSP70 family sugar kinase